MILHDLCLFAWEPKDFVYHEKIAYNYVFLQVLLAWQHSWYPSSLSLHCTWTHMVPCTCSSSSDHFSNMRLWPFSFRFHASCLIIQPFSLAFPIRLPQPSRTHCSHLHQRFVRHGTFFTLTVPPSSTFPFDNRQTEPQCKIIRGKMLFTEVCSLRNGVGLVQRLNLLFFTSMTWRQPRFSGC